MSEIAIMKEFLQHIPIKNSLKKHVLFYQSVEKIAQKITEEVPQLEQLRLNPDLTLLICIVVEELVPKQADVDKKLLVVSVLDKLFTLTDDEKSVIEGQIQHNYDEKQIKKVPFWKKAMTLLGKLAFSFFFQ